jgi:capsid protein
MSLQTNLSNLATRVGNEAKALRTLVNGNLSDLSTLTTTQKTSLVAAINELKSAIDAIDSGSAINDAATNTTEGWSSQKISDELVALKDEILGPGVSTALDTLKELADALAENDGDIATITTALGNRVRFDAAQTLDVAQQLQARQNIGAASSADVGDTTTNFVTVFEAALV